MANGRIQNRLAMITRSEGQFMDASDTDQLVNRAQLGDQSAQQQLLVRHRPRLRRMVVSMLDSRLSARIDPSDILQDAFTIAARRLPNYLEKRPVAFYPWLREIVKDLLIDVHRRHIRAQCRSVAKEEQFDFQLSDNSAMQIADRLTSRDPSPSNALNQLELNRRIKTAMDQMRVCDRELLLMRFVEQLSIREVAEVLTITEPTARARLRRAIEALGRVIFKQEGSDE